MLAFQPGKAAHATAIIIGEAGILFTGASGTGKSATALACIDAAHQRGWHAALIADDGVILEPAARLASNSRIIARCPESIAGKVELRGSGILSPPWRSRTRLHMVVAPGSPTGAGRLPPPHSLCRIGEGVLPLVFLHYDGIAPLKALELIAEERGIHLPQGQLGQKRQVGDILS